MLARPEKSRPRPTALSAVAALLLFMLPMAADAQDRFGTSVAVVDGQILALKPTPARGPAAVYVFGQRAGAWEVSGRLFPEAGAAGGHSLGGNLLLGGDRVLVAAGDPTGADAAWVFSLDASDSPDRLPISEDATTGPPDEVTLGTVMSLLSPPRRRIASEGGLVAVLAHAGSELDLYVFEAGMSGWTRSEVEMATSLAGSRPGGALAVHDGAIYLGAPGHEGSGAVIMYGRGQSGGWVEQAVITAPNAAPDLAFGTALLPTRVGLLIGAPGGEAIFRAEVADDGGVTVTSLFERDEPGGRFGSALALSGEELWVSAPATDEGRGAVHVLRLSDEGLEPRQQVAASGSEPRWGFGADLAVDGDIAAVGAPFADGGIGRVAVFQRDGQGAWEHTEWLRHPEARLEALAGDEIRCEDGEAAGFACDRVDLLAYLPPTEIGGTAGEGMSDLWGWTDPETGREYALVGRSGGAAFVDITDPASPRYLGALEAPRSGARDLKVYADHLFFTGDGAGQHGLIVFDLTRLRDVGAEPVAFEADARYENVASAHNLVIDTESGFAFTVGSSGGGETCGGGLHMVDIRDPKNPTFAGCYTDTEGLLYPGRTHDAQCTVYRGPDEDHAGKQLCFASNETALRIVDVSDKENPVPIAAATYPGIAYVHQGWLTDDHRYFYLDDELDELIGITENTRTLIWDVSDLDDPELVGDYLSPATSTDHNLYIVGDRMYQANYQSGLRVVDISDREAPVEVGYFDTTPYDADPPGFVGAWTAYPFFESGTVIVSSMTEGLFILRPRSTELVP